MSQVVEVSVPYKFQTLLRNLRGLHSKVGLDLLALFRVVEVGVLHTFRVISGAAGDSMVKGTVLNETGFLSASIGCEDFGHGGGPEEEEDRADKKSSESALNVRMSTEPDAAPPFLVPFATSSVGF